MHKRKAEEIFSPTVALSLSALLIRLFDLRREMALAVALALAATAGLGKRRYQLKHDN